MLLKEGDTVRVRHPVHSCRERFDGTGIYHGRSSTNSGSVAIERHDEQKGAAQNGWWNFPQDEVKNLEIVKRNGRALASKARLPRSTPLRWIRAYLEAKSGGYVDPRKTRKQIKEVDQIIRSVKAIYRRLLRRGADTDVLQQKEVEMSSLVEKKINLEENLEQSLGRITPREVLRKLTSHPMVDRIRSGNIPSELIITTKTISIDDVKIGKFDLRIHESSRIFMSNTSYSCGGYDHPHVSCGSPCLEDWDEPLETYFESGNLYLFLDTVIAYLSTVTEGGEYIALENYLEDRTKITHKR